MLSHVAGMNQTVHVEHLRLIVYRVLFYRTLWILVGNPLLVDSHFTLMNLMLFNHLFHSILLADTLSTLRPAHVVIHLLPLRLINFLLLMLIPVLVGALDIVSIVLIIVNGDPTPNC